LNYWLMKSEPDVFSIQDLKKKKRTGWDGVRNYQARNYMRDQMKVGDLVLFYHSNAEPPGIAGVAKVSAVGLVDPLQFDKKSEYYDPKSKPDAPTWLMVEVEFVEELPLIPLDRLKKEPALKDMPLVQKGTRLSVMPVAKKEWDHVLALKGTL